ncbi:Cys-tRNA(Pro) deacylase [Flavonifractor plautii]|uniref:Cys-tRNA(Pro)/Cys-tRNA(Cys) deacylase n=1 Tax=Candidatus Flavonifractor intestinigallinarum TaxID=2838586 RepID=A0A9D2MKM7_9FIRM|nr:Cys-tRNA(Pro) deacylase [Flavonifractor plautii]MBM6665094.1 Cys-tRNA(Pro) deacylase [Flavonifractor plautii]HJB79450.1 Cys-tRNA(Pro) deacylase [Candidatus Flavonifractor intestinigallinarum]
MSEEKTNVMRVLDQKKVPYTPHHYAHPDGAVDGASVAALIDKDPASVCKTLVTQGASKKYYVFVIPVLKELDLKAAAKAVGEKSIEMIKQAQLLPLTGYVHGGCSPVGMKKQFPTVFDQSVEGLDTITVSAGKIGAQVEVAPAALAVLVRGRFAPVTK